MRSLPLLGAAALMSVPAGAWALGLGNIKLESALNEPFRAEIALVAARPDELQSLKVSLASPAAFKRYGLQMPTDLSTLKFSVSTNAAGQAVVLVTSNQRIDDPFLTMLVEATWPRGRLLREYTVLLDPPVLAPGRSEQSVSQLAQAQSTPSASASGTIPRSTAVAQSVPGEAAGVSEPATQATQSVPENATASRPAKTTATAAAAAADSSTVPAAKATSAGATSSASPKSYGPVQRGDTLWGIARATKPGDVTTNQMMVAIYQANPGAFQDNINLLNRGATLDIPEHSGLLGLSPAAATAEVKRQAALWEQYRGASATAASNGAAATTQTGSAQASEARLRLVPPDEVSLAGGSGTGNDTEAGASGSASAGGTASAGAVAKLQGQVSSLRDQLGEQQRLLQLKDAQLAALQNQLEQARTGNSASAATAATAVTAPGAQLESTTTAQTASTAPETPFDSQTQTDEPASTSKAPEAAVEQPPSTTVANEPAAAAATPTAAATAATGATPASVRASNVTTPSLLSRIVGWIANPFLLIGLGIAAVLLTAVWFIRNRSEDEEDVTGRWDALEAEIEQETLASTSRFRQGDGSGIVVEESAASMPSNSLMESTDADDSGVASAADDLFAATATEADDDALNALTDEHAGVFDASSADQSTSSQSMVDFDQGNPIAEADFHMGYGLYDQAAEVVAKAVESEPERHDLRLKLLEVYFVWGNKDAFLDAAQNFQANVESSDTDDWSKVLIMGKQICPDEPLFAESAGADSVDLDFESEASVDLDFPLEETEANEIDLALDDGNGTSPGLELAATGEMFTRTEAGDGSGPGRQGSSLGDSASFEIGVQTAASLEEALFLDDDEGSQTSAGNESFATDPGLGETQESPMPGGFGQEEDDWGTLLDEAAAGNEQTGTHQAHVAADDLDADSTGRYAPLDRDSLDSEALTVETPTVETTYTSDEPVSDTLAPTMAAETLGLDMMGAGETGGWTTRDMEAIDLDELGLSYSDLDAPADDDAPVTGEASDTGTDIDGAFGTADAELLADELLAEPASTDNDFDFDSTDGERQAADPATDDYSASDETAVAQLSGDETDFLQQANVDSDDPDTLRGTSVLRDEDVADLPSFDSDQQFEASVAFETEAPDDNTLNKALSEFEADMPKDAAPAGPESLNVASTDGDTVREQTLTGLDGLAGLQPAEDLHEATGTELPHSLVEDALTEVGTKIDLARAYIDMGDPDGARSILEEVLSEGDTGQRDEARGLMDALIA